MPDLEIENTARKYLRVRFKHQGRIPNIPLEKGPDGIVKGYLDCAGLVIKVAHDLKKSEFDFTNYRLNPDTVTMRKYLNSNMDRIEEKEVGCVFYMAFHKHPQHLAIYTSKDTIIHAASLYGKVVEHRLDDFWTSKIKEIYKYRR